MDNVFTFMILCNPLAAVADLNWKGAVSHERKSQRSFYNTLFG